MSQIFLHLTPLKEEYNSEEEDDVNEQKIESRRLSIKNPINMSELNLNLNMDLNDYNIGNNNKIRHKSPSKRKNSVDLINKKLLLDKNTSKVDLCLYALEYPPIKRNQEMINHIKTYLKTMPSLMNIISKEQNAGLSENLIEEISIHLRHEYIPRNNLVCRFGERGEKFYIILKGKVTFLVPKLIKCYLNFEEYITYLMQLRKNDEFELLNNLLVQNRILYPFEDDDLDEFLLNEYEDYEKNMKKTGRKNIKSKTGKNNFKMNFNINSLNKEEKAEKEKENETTERNKNRTSRTNLDNDYDLNTNLKLNLKFEERSTIKRITAVNNKYVNRLNPPPSLQKKNYFSYETYKKMKAVVEKINQGKRASILDLNNSNYLSGENSVKNYLKANNVHDLELESLGRKLVHVYHYEEMSTFDSGQTFGFIALQSKACKRASTAIVVEGCDLGVLTKDEYLQFFESLNMKEKKNLYELLKFYSLITSVSEHKFIKRFYHMFEYKRYQKNNAILELNKPFNELFVFSSGLFVIHIIVNIPELNDLITKIKTIRGKLLGLSKYKIERTLEEKRENQDLNIRRNYMSERESKILLKKYNYTISMVSDHLILGYPDTVDPVTHLPLFNCVCTSAYCEGYSISNKSIALINQESVVIHNLKEFCLMKMDYNLTRLKQFKKEILSKMKADEISSITESKEQKGNNDENFNEMNYKENIKENGNNDKNNIKMDNHTSDNFSYINRNELNMFKNMNSNKKKLLTNKLNHDSIENVISIINNSKNEEVKNTFNSNSRRSYNTFSRNNKLSNIAPFNSDKNNQKEKNESTTISKLRESILSKKKKIELKIEENNSQTNYNKFKSNDPNIIKHSLSSESYNKNFGKESNINNNDRNNTLSKSLKKMKLNSMSLFKSYLKDIDKIKSYNNKMLTPFLTKNGLSILPSIKNKNKKLKNFFKESNKIIKTENKIHKKIEKNINEDLYRIDQLSFVKEKFIVFKSDKKNKKEAFNTINFDYLPKIKGNKNQPMKIKKQFFSGILNGNTISNNKNNNDINKDNEDKKFNFSNTMNSKLIAKQNTLQKNINEKYNELNVLVNNMQNITKEILSKKV